MENFIEIIVNTKDKNKGGEITLPFNEYNLRVCINFLEGLFPEEDIGKKDEISEKEINQITEEEPEIPVAVKEKIPTKSPRRQHLSDLGKKRHNLAHKIKKENPDLDYFESLRKAGEIMRGELPENKDQSEKGVDRKIKVALGGRNGICKWIVSK